LELRLTPLEAYWHLQQVLERVNAISSSLITNETFRLDETEDFTDNLEKVRALRACLRARVKGRKVGKGRRAVGLAAILLFLLLLLLLRAIAHPARPNTSVPN
jgi:hypothetical protein